MDRSSEEVVFIASSFGPHVDADSEFDESDVSETSLQVGDSMTDDDYEENDDYEESEHLPLRRKEWTGHSRAIFQKPRILA